MRRRHLIVLSAVLSVGLMAGACGRSSSDSATGGSTPATNTGAAKCSGATLEATEIGVTDSTISVEVMADTGSPLAPGLFQGNVDGIKAYAKWINANGGVGCRQLKVDEWDSKLSPEEAKNGLINGCKNDLAMVGGNSLFNPDVTELSNCPDKAGQPLGLPDFTALAVDRNEACAVNVWSVQAVTDSCNADGSPVNGPRVIKNLVGAAKYEQTVEPNLKGVFIVPGDLPTTVQSTTPIIEAQKQIGISIVDAMKFSGSASQSAYTPLVQTLKDSGGNYVYNGHNDSAMIKMRKETAAQGYDGVKVWACSLSCYTDAFKAAGSAVDGTYVWTQFLPFEEAADNATIKAYVDAVGGKPDSWGIQSWQAGMVFKETIDRIVTKSGPNAITRKSVIETMKTVTDFDAAGSMAPKGPKDASDCYVLLQIENGQFHRVSGKAGTFDCDPANILTLPAFDPQAEAAKVH